MFRCLVQLREIHVSECQILKEIVHVRYEDETIKLTQLHTLTLESLPQLEGFCSPTNKDSAEILSVDESEYFFGKKIQFPNLVELKLSLINVEKIWHNHSIEFYPFDKLTTFIVEGCGNFASVLTSSVVRSLAQLKKFEICDCKSMEEVIRTVGETEKIIFPKLSYLKLKGLPKVVKFCSGNLIQCPSMEVLLIENCARLQTFVSISDEDTSTLFDEKVDFPNLDQLIVSGVNGLKVIWGNELSEESFRKLKALRVQDAKQVVKVFPPNLGLTRFQNLEDLYILGCDALTEVYDIRTLIDVKIERGGVTVTQLKKLWVFDTPNLKHVWNEDPKGILEFQNLSHVDIRGCPSLQSVFPASVARGLLNLEKFEVCDSGIKEIVAGDEEQIQGASVFEFPRLKELSFRRLPQLETFYPGTHTSEWPALKALFITQCNQFHLPTLFHEMIIPNLEELALNDKSVRMIREGQLPVELFHKLKVVEFNFFDEKSAVFPYDLLHIFHSLETLQMSISGFKELFPPEGVFVGDEKHPLILTRMHSLELYYLPNLKTIWNQVLQTLKSLLIHRCDNLIILAPSSASFRSLTSLNIEDCKGLLSLVTSSTAKSLIQLQKLKVSKCDRVKVIISDDRDEIMDEINFIKLETLELDGLLSLTSFCSGNHSFKFPSLTKVVVNQCPKMEFFSKGVSTTSMLTRVQLTEEENKGDWLGNLNSTMCFLYKKMVGFCGLQHLKVSEFSNLRDRWHNELPVEFFCDLVSLVIDECAFSSYAIPSNLLEYLNKLEELGVSNCEVLEEVFDVRGLSAEHGHADLLSRLNKFHLISLPRLRNIWNGHAQGILNFKHLKSLKVHHCSSLKRIFTPSMTQGLVQLQEMEVKYCNSVEEIITRGATNEVIKDIIFPLLQSIILESLPGLINLNCGSKILKCPSLEEIAIVDCPTTFTCTFLRDLQPNPADGITEPKVVFSNLKDLKLSLVKIQKIWYNKQQLGMSAFTENLTSLNIDGCGNLKYLFSSAMVKGSIHLKTLEICNCKLMEEIIHMEKSGKIGEIVLRKLENLKLQNLQQLAHFCTGNLIECVGLTSLSIENCPELSAFISNSAISNNLNSTCSPDILNSTLFDKKVDFPNLETLIISGVNGLKEIWGNELREDSFCKLKGLRVQDAKAVVKVFPPNLDLKRFENLEELCIHGCDALTEVFDIRALIDVKIERGGVTVTQLQKIWVFDNPNLKHVWNEDPKGILDFHNLSNVDIRGCASLKSVFPASIARGLVHLELLYVVDSAIKEIVAGDEERIQGASAFQFPQLKELILRRLPQLEKFYPGTHTSEWPALQKLCVTECYQFQHPTLSFKEIIPNMEELALNGKEVRMIHEGQLPTELFHKLKVVEFNFFNEKSAVFPYDLLHIFQNLETLKVSRSKFKELFPPEGVFVGDEKHPLILTRMHSLELYRLPNLKTMCNQFLPTLETLYIEGCDSLIILTPSSAAFQSLTSLDIYNCMGLVSLVTFSRATSLMRLESLRISNCNQVKVIVSDEGDETMNEINFIKLETLVLDCLPNLTSFCLANHSFKFPSLTKVVVNQCPKMEFFSKGVSVTPMLPSVLTEDENGGDWLGNLNMTISFLYRKMVGFRGLQHLKLSEFSHLKERWHNELPVEIFWDLNSLVIDEVAFSSYAIPSNLLKYLNKLDKLEVNNCELLEEVFDPQGLSDEAQGQIGLLSKLNSFHLINLPRLRLVWNEHPQRILNFKHLKSLKVHNCCNLRMIFTPSMTQGLVQLQEMEVKNCVSVEEIISKGAEEDDMISFPQLNSLVLDSLPKLTVFRPGRGIVQCPSLEKITVMDCPKIEVFTSSSYEEVEPIKFMEIPSSLERLHAKA
ncbi:uncharacterized protein [Euphorbia lathyris]|uniref:uncharacterized protein n=1 Tax=Euphorbia lathyris TaxID=212925 RepID=UPI0033143C58